MNKRAQARRDRLLPNGMPHYVRCYDSGDSAFDRYTVVYTGNYRKSTGDALIYVGMSEHPTWPTGFGQHGQSFTPIDRPRYGHLGKRIGFDELPVDCQKLVLYDYKELWDLE